ncbi:fimbrial biogenesis chaperone [Intestinirhabdus alba]|jgi:P pilus assembly chaperone PapD|uniref:Fimbria/pilus periplasmic chaperone n=1 Tax=Intestinirhabdus alba TaxID=2899544 RepID=A0A6L6IJV1_9ENTR|nr:molecular chaperone [Intestinirhabdus alba]MTH47111.1 fimbria/pilus periplasmic chaperone [Intestinirhabdus alba]
MPIIKTSVVYLSCCAAPLFFIGSASASLILDQNRVVFSAAASQVAVVKVENPTSNDFLMQSWVEDKNGNPQEDIFVDPPLAKIKAQRKVALRLTAINPRLADGNEEKLYWLNVKEIPRLVAAEGSPRLEIVVRTRIKLLYRPKSVPPRLDKHYSQLKWRRSANGIMIHNPTPYYITFNKIWSGSNEQNNFAVDMIAPYSDLEIKDSRALAASRINFNVINDFGDTTDTVTAKVN